MFKLIGNINWLIDVYYHWRRLNKRLKRIRYYRRHRKIKPEHTPILTIYKNAISWYFKRVYDTFFPKKSDKSLNDAFCKELEIYQTLKEKRESELAWVYSPKTQHEITHVRYIGYQGGSYYTKGKIYPIQRFYKSGIDSFQSVFFYANNGLESCRIVFSKNGERRNEDEFELIYDNQIA